MLNTLRFMLFVLIFGTIMPILNAQTTCREVIGYYPNWQWYDRNKLVAPATIDYGQYSIINYCFFSPQPDGTIQNTDSWADENLLLGEIDWSTTPPGYIPNTSLIDLAHNAGVKVLVSIGGWTLSDNFPAIAADPVARATFASECNRLLSFYNFDGIDIDWEYPGYVPHGGSSQDKGNFTLLMQQIRDSIDALGLITGKSYLLTSCFGPSPAHAANIEWNNLISVVDMFNIMSYDYFGAFDCLANHNAPLFAPASGDPNFNLTSTFHMLVNQYQVPPNKINMGVAFYGRSQTGASALFAPTSCNPDNLTFPEDLGTPLYYNILAKEYLFDKHRDIIAAVPYLLGKPGTAAAGTFVSFDDVQSIAEKAVFVATEQIRGVIIWEITGDYVETAAGTGIIAGTPLVDTINKIFCQYINTPPMPGAIAPHVLQIVAYPVPAKTSTNLQIRAATKGKAEIIVSNMNGQVVQREYFLIQSPNIEIPISLAGLSEGMYLITVTTASDISHTKLCISR